jgi:hypothetical protein
VLAEHPLHGDDFGLVLVEPLLDALLDGDEAQAQLGVHRSAYDSDAAHGQGPARDTFDHPDTASGQSRVNAQHPHPTPPFAAEPPPLSRKWLIAIVVPRLMVAVPMDCDHHPSPTG